METALSHITVLPATKAEINAFVEKAKEEILNGMNNPLQVNILLKSLEETVKALRSDQDIKDAIQFELDKFTEKTFDAFGATITKSVRRDVDYSSDPVYADLVKQAEQLKAVIKAREEVLKSSLNPETGETFPPFPFTETPIVTIKLK